MVESVRKYWVGDVVFHGERLVEVAANGDASGIVLCRDANNQIIEIPDYELRVPTEQERDAIWASILKKD